MYTVIGSTASRAGRVLWLLEELGQPYVHDPAHPHAPSVVAVNPTGKVPVLLDNGATITDSTAILQYLADRHGAFTAPAGTLARAQQDSMTQCLLDELDSAVWMAARHSFVLPPEERMPQIKDSLKREYARSLAGLTRRLGNSPFVAGEQMTIADIIFAHCLDWAATARFPPPGPALAQRLAGLTARPAYQRVYAA